MTSCKTTAYLILFNSGERLSPVKQLLNSIGHLIIKFRLEFYEQTFRRDFVKKKSFKRNLRWALFQISYLVLTFVDTKP